ncbi:MAG: PAS domain S-box protein, partial [Calditrichaeota bacterium]
MAWRILLLGGDSKQQRALAEKIRARFPDARLTYQPNMAAWPEPRVRDKFDIILAGPSIDWSQLESLLSGLKENDDATPLVVFSRNPQGMVSSHSEASLRHPKAQQEMLGKIITNLLEDRSSTSSSEGEHFEAHRQFWVDRAGRVHGQLSILNLWPNARGQEDEPPQWEKMFPQISLQQIKKQLAATTSEGDVNYRFVIRAANGQSFLVTLCPNTSLDSADGQILFWGEIEELPSISLPVENPIESEEHETQPLFTQEWESVLGFLGIGIAVVDDEFRVLWANQAWWQILQVSQVPSPGVSLFQTIRNSTPWTSESIAAFQKQLASLGRETFVLEVQLCESATGWEHWFKLKQTSLSEDRKVLFFQDLTAEKKAHQELEVLAQALRSTTECISITDLDNRIIFVNDAFIRVYGYAREELIGQSVSRLRPEGFSEEKDRQILEATLRGGWQGEVMNRRKDGSVFPVFLSTSAVRDSRGQIVALIGVARDISERKAQEAALRESQSQLRSLLDKAPEAIILYEIGTDRFKDANPQAFKLFGYSPERFFECSLLDLCPQYQPNGRLSSELIEEYLTRARQGEDPSFEWVHVTADKKPIWCEVHLTYFVANNQEYVRGTILDISERKRIEKELRQSEAKFRSFFENSLDIVFTTDARGHIVDINAAVETVLGYKPAELRGSSLFQLAADPHAAQRVVEKLLQQGYVRAQEVRGWSRDGSVKIGLLSATVLRNENGRLAGVQGIVQDITERKAQEEEIYRLATVVQQSKEGVIITDEKGFVIYANPAFQKLTGQTRGSVLGLPFRRVFSGMGSEQLKTVWDLLKKRKYWQGTLVQTKKDGTETHRFISAFPIEDSYGRVINYAFIVRDLTKEKQLEHQLQQMQRLEAIGQMAGSIAHDFNNLLSLILGYAELIQSTYGHIPGLEKDVERIIEATESGARLTDQLLAFGRRQMIQPKLLDLSEYIAGLQNMLRRLLEDTIA